MQLNGKRMEKDASEGGILSGEFYYIEVRSLTYVNRQIFLCSQSREMGTTRWEGSAHLGPGS